MFEKWGSKRALIGKVADHCREHSNCTDVLAILEPLLASSAAAGSPSIYYRR